MTPIKILLVGGTWELGEDSAHCGRKSSFVEKMYNAIIRLKQVLFVADSDFDVDCAMFNGGNFSVLNKCLDCTKDADITIWMPNVPDNNLPKLRNVKEISPRTILITSKRNLDGKYSFGDIVRRALGTKSNLLIEFTKGESNLFNMSVIDPLGNEWYSGTDIEKMVHVLIERALFLKGITRKSTVRFDDLFERSEQTKSVDVDKFIELVQRCGKVFAEYTPSANNTTRLLGNCSLAQTTRCSKGFPTMRTNSGVVYVSQRNVDKQALSIDNLVPTKDTRGGICYCGENKPSVDTPIQLQLYKKLPNINYMIHSHCYIKDAPFTKQCIPCGGLEEVDEIMEIINFSVCGKDILYYAINLKGHGSLVMANSLALLEGIEKQYYPREFPEVQYE